MNFRKNEKGGGTGKEPNQDTQGISLGIFKFCLSFSLKAL